MFRGRLYPSGWRYMVRLHAHVTDSTVMFSNRPESVIHRSLVALTTLMLTVGGCTSVPPKPAPALPAEPQPAPAPPAAPVAEPAIDWDRLDELLTKGDDALKEDRLLTPIDDCAYDYYQQALQVAPDHPAARHGLDRIVDRYIALASEATQRGQHDRAQNILERAKFINAEHQGIAMAEAQLRLFADANRVRVPLDGAELAARSQSLSDQLAALGVRAKAEGTWVVIIARNDAEGRWIYQQLRRAPGERRMRAELILGAPPRIELVALADATLDIP